MIPDLDADDSTAYSSSPGQQLRAAREARRLERADVARELRLTERVLDALETDDYEHLPEEVFVRGYIRNYARLMGLSADPLLADYARLNPQARAVRIDTAGVRTKQLHSSHLVVKLVTAAIVIALIAGVLLWWQAREEPTRRDASSAPAERGERGSVTTPARTVALPPAAVRVPFVTADDLANAPANPLDTPASAETAAPVPEFVAAVPVQPPADLPDAPAPVPEANRAPLAAQAPSTEPPTAAGPTPAVVETAAAPVAKAGGLELRFAEDCWVDVRDANGARVLFGTIQAGSSRPLDGAPPFRMTLGNAAAVTLLEDGQPVDLAPHTRGNIARLSAGTPTLD